MLGNREKAGKVEMLASSKSQEKGLLTDDVPLQMTLCNAF